MPDGVLTYSFTEPLAAAEEPRCKVCGRFFSSRHPMSSFCSVLCKDGGSGPAVYCFTCPDGRNYVGSCNNVSGRKRRGMKAYWSNLRVRKALKKYPSETWTFEILETLPIATPRGDRLAIEQRYIDQFRSWEPQFGFNVNAASQKSRQQLKHGREESTRLTRGKKAPVALRALKQRLIRSLRGRGTGDQDRHFLVDLRRSAVVETDVGPRREEMARELGCLEEWEEAARD